jgi:hypothetical protein
MNEVKQMITISAEPGDFELVLVERKPVKINPDKIQPVTGPYAALTAIGALITVEVGEIRFRIDGHAPLDSGHTLRFGEALYLGNTAAIRNFAAVTIYVTRHFVSNSEVAVTLFFKNRGPG